MSEPHGPGTGEADYAEKLAIEQRIFRDNLNVHDLPDIFHHYSIRHLQPRLEALGVPAFHELFLVPIRRQLERRPGVVKVASLGAGNCDFEVDLLKRLAAEGHTRVEMHCYELNRDMLERGREHATRAGVMDRVRLMHGDVNRDEFPEPYEVFLANQSLHHFVELERLFADIHRSLQPGGVFVASDMIGRNGHQYWPEALEVIDHLWPLLPRRYKYHHQFQQFQDRYLNWDCSTEGFEGIRAQDILALLVKSFHFEMFFAFSCVIDVFTGRAFGHNFSKDEPFDRAFIDFVAELDERLLAEGTLKPTHLMAWMTREDPGSTLAFGGQRPADCIRDPEAAPR